MVKISSKGLVFPVIESQLLFTSNELFSLDKSIFKPTMPFGFYYDVLSEKHVPNGIEVGANDYTLFLRLCRFRNNRNFLLLLRDKTSEELIKEFEMQLFYFSKKLKGISQKQQRLEICKWFEYTEYLLNKKSVMYFDGLESRHANYEFHKWRLKKETDMIGRDAKKRKNKSVDKIVTTSNISSNPAFSKKVNSKNFAPENDFTLSTIEDFLEPFKDAVQTPSMTLLVKSLHLYFSKGAFPVNIKEIKVGKVNSKAFGWALYEIYKSLKTNKEKLSYEYLKFGKDNISIFKDVKLTTNDMKKCNLYKYYTTKTLMKSA